MLSADASPPVDHAGLHRRDRAEEYFVRGVRKACGANRRRHHRNCSEVCAHLGVLPAWQHNPKWLGGDLGARLNARWVCKRSHDNKHGKRVRPTRHRHRSPKRDFQQIRSKNAKSQTCSHSTLKKHVDKAVLPRISAVDTRLRPTGLRPCRKRVMPQLHGSTSCDFSQTKASSTLRPPKHV